MESVAPVDPRAKRLAYLIVFGITIAVFGGVYLAVRRKIFPPPNIVYVDNLGAGAITLFIDGKSIGSVAAHALAQRDLDNGHHVIDVRDGDRIVAHHELELGGHQCVIVVGGTEAIAVDVVPYGAPRSVEAQAYLARSNAEGTLWVAPMQGIDEGIDEAFPKTVSTKSSGIVKRRHLCRVLGGAPQCEGGPSEITSRERY